MVKGLAHICFVVKDLEASIAFYRDRLGFTPAFDFTNDKGERYGVYLRVGGRSFIELFKGEVEARAAKQSYSHFCLEVDDIQGTARQLRAAGLEVSEVKMGMDNSWQAWLEDPDGNRIELHEYTAKSWQAPWLQ
jgi:catechol 2,3-dioxygenase-like lactoylglutathione lyase family enzyme